MSNPDGNGITATRVVDAQTERLVQAAQDGHSLCWFCKSEVGEEQLCPSCVKIQPLGRDSDYFSVMGLPRRLTIDTRILEPVFHALSRRFHPDRYRMATSRERVIALENSALLNQAYRTLRDPFERAAYLLQLEQGREQAARDSPPQALFEEILEVQELLGDYRLGDEEERQSLRGALDQKREALQQEQDRLAAALTGELFTQWDALLDAGNPPAEQKAAVLDVMRRTLGERAYLRRVLNGLNEALCR